MAAWKTDEYTAQVLAATNGAAMADGQRTGDKLRVARVKYTTVGTEAAADTIGLVQLGPGATVIPALCSVYSADPGTTLTGIVGISTDTDAYSSALTLDAGGQIRFTGTALPAEFTAPTLVYFTISTAAAISVGVVLEFTIVFASRH